MRKSLFFSIALLLAGTGPVAAFSGTITTDTSWSGTVTLDGDVVVEAGILTISAGTVVEAVKTDRDDSTANLAGDGRVGIRVTGTGAVQAVGTEQDPIVFTSAAENDTAGDWWGIELLYVQNDSLNIFEYCTVEYGFRAFTAGTQEKEFGDSLGWAEPSDVTINHCLLQHIEKDAIFIAANGNLSVSYSEIKDAEMGIFIRGTDQNLIEYTTIWDVSCGINLVCDEPNTQTHETDVVVDHLTMYGVDMLKSDNPKWWTGYGVFCTNNRGVGTLGLTNSILVQSTLANLSIDTRGIWTVTEHHNCFYTGMLGLMNIENGTADSTDITGDFSSPVEPLFVDPAGGDFRIVEGSPVLDAGSDGETMGSYTGTPVPPSRIIVPGANVQSNARVRIVGRDDGFGLQVNLPAAATVSARVYDQNGTLVRLNAQDMDAGSGILPLGSPDISGIYFVAYSVGGINGTLRITVVR